VFSIIFYFVPPVLINRDVDEYMALLGLLIEERESVLNLLAFADMLIIFLTSFDVSLII